QHPSTRHRLAANSLCGHAAVVGIASQLTATFERAVHYGDDAWLLQGTTGLSRENLRREDAGVRKFPHAAEAHEHTDRHGDWRRYGEARSHPRRWLEPRRWREGDDADGRIYEIHHGFGR